MVNIDLMFNGRHSVSKHLSLADLPDNDVTADDPWDHAVFRDSSSSWSQQRNTS